MTFVEDLQFQGTRTVDLCPNLVAGSGDVCSHAESVGGSFVVHPVTSESVSERTLGVGLDQEIASGPN